LSPCPFQDDFQLSAYWEMGKQLGCAGDRPASPSAAQRPVAAALGLHLTRMGSSDLVELLEQMGFDRFDIRAVRARRMTGGWV
jgi:hypothetical protein